MACSWSRRLRSYVAAACVAVCVGNNSSAVAGNESLILVMVMMYLRATLTPTPSPCARERGEAAATFRT